uniref:K Homology domain-containing protein n=1 Tax=Cannabis sativa TaxID=3483 RepID=A0A803NLA5_CANSA
MASVPSPYQTHVPLPSHPDEKSPIAEPQIFVVPIHIVTHASQLPAEFLEPSSERQIVIGFDCEGADLCRHGALCIMQLAFPDAIYLVDAIQGGEMLIKACTLFSVWHQVEQRGGYPGIAYSLIEEQEGRARSSDDYISFVGLLADPRYCGISYLEKEEVRVLLRQDPKFWTYRPLSELMVRAAADDVRFLLYIYHKMMAKLNERTLWYLQFRGALYCRCYCVNDNNYADWPSLPPVPDNLIVEGKAPEEEILSVLDVPPGKMGCIIGRRGATILLIKESCNAEILIGGSRGPPDKVFIIGAVKEVRKAEAMLRGRMLDL